MIRHEVMGRPPRHRPSLGNVFRLDAASTLRPNGWTKCEGENGQKNEENGLSNLQTHSRSLRTTTVTTPSLCIVMPVQNRNKAKFGWTPRYCTIAVLSDPIKWLM